MNKRIFFSAALLTGFFFHSNVNSESLLPEGFSFVNEPNPGAGYCSSCKGGEKQGMEKPSQREDGLAILDINLETVPSVKNFLLSIELGTRFSFFPSEKYQILPPGAKNGDKEFLIARLGQKKVLFKTTVNDIGNLKFYSYNYPGYSICRDGDKLSLTDKNIEYLFGSFDGGYTWKLSCIKDRDFPAKQVKCEYNKDGLMKSIVLSDGNSYTIDYKDGLAVKVNDPAGAVTEISWDEKSYIKNIKTSLLPEHPFYPRENMKKDKKGQPLLYIVRDIRSECDNMGRLLSLVNTSGERFIAEYRSDKDTKSKKETFIGILSFPDKEKKYYRSVWNSDGTKKIDKGYILSGSKGVEEFVCEEEFLMKKKASTFTSFEKIINGRTYILKRDGKTLAVTSETDPLGRTTKFTYDDQGRRTSIIYPDGSELKYKYDSSDRLIEIVTEMGKSTKYEFNDKGQLVSTDKAGIVTKYEYNEKGCPVKTILADGTVHQFEWDELFRMVSHTKPTGVKTVYSYAGLLNIVSEVKTVSNDAKETYAKNFAYDPQGRLTKTGYPDGTAENFAYDCCNLVKYTDRAGAPTKYVYNSAHLKVMEISPNNEKTSFSYNEKGKLIKTLYPNGTSQAVEYDKYGNLTKLTNPDGTWAKYTYDAFGNKTLMEKSDGTKSEYAYDKRNRVVSVKGDAERNMEYVYDNGGQVIEALDYGLPYSSEARKTEFTYDNAEHNVKTVHADGTTSVNYYREGTNLLTGTLSKGIIARYGYNDAGQLVSAARYPVEDLKKARTSEEKEALFKSNIFESRSYDIFGNLFEVRNAEGRLLSRHSYSPDGDLASVLQPTSDTGAVKQSYVYKYSSDGIRLVSIYKKLVENPKFAALDYREEYGVYQLVSLDKNIKPDTLGRKVMEYAQKGDRRLYSVNELGRKTEYRYNEMGQLVELLSNGEKENVYKYDNRGRVAEAEDVLGRTYRRIYGEDNRITKLIQPDGTQSDFDYDRFGHLIKREGAGAYPLSYNYTSFGEIASYRDAQGAETKFLYDKHGRMTSRIWPDGSTTVYKYGKNGLLEVKEEAGRVTGYVYDNMNRLVKTQTVYGGEASFTEMCYDKDGRLIKVSDGKTSIEYTYDKYGRVIVEDGPVGIIRYVYNAEGLLFAKSCEFKENPGQFLTKYYYDEFSRVNKVESQAGIYTYTYDTKERIASLNMGDRIKIDYAYDKADRLISKTLNGETLCKYEYDKLNRRVKAEVNGIKWDYGYDIYNQLTSAKADDGKTYSYEYDKIGNRLKFNQTAMVYNKLNQISINGYQYDKWGNLLRTPDTSYKYDLNNRLLEVKKNEVTVKYSYDPLGQRIEAVENVKGQEKTTKYLMSGMVELARISGGVTQYHTLGLDLAQSLNRTGGVGAVLATTSNNISFDYLYDGNGNVIATSNNDGNISEKLNYSPFGEILSGKTQIPFTFSTKPVDSSGLSYYGYRFYSHSDGFWLTKDPIKEFGGINFYSYNYNNPIKYYDYLGLAICCINGVPVSYDEKTKYCKNNMLYDIPSESLLIRANGVLWANDNIGNEAYGPQNELNIWWPAGVNKCNKFVADAFNKGNDQTIIDDGLRGTTPPTAADFFDGTVPGFVEVSHPLPGDVATNSHHVGIVSGTNKTISASSVENRVVENNWGFRATPMENGGTMKFYRYVGVAQ